MKTDNVITITITGRQGIGKSRLLHYLLPKIQAAGLAGVVEDSSVPGGFLPFLAKRKRGVADLGARPPYSPDRVTVRLVVPEKAP